MTILFWHVHHNRLRTSLLYSYRFLYSFVHSHFNSLLRKYRIGWCNDSIITLLDNNFHSIVTYYLRLFSLGCFAFSILLLIFNHNLGYLNRLFHLNNGRRVLLGENLYGNRFHRYRITIIGRHLLLDDLRNLDLLNRSFRNGLYCNWSFRNLKIGNLYRSCNLFGILDTFSIILIVLVNLTGFEHGERLVDTLLYGIGRSKRDLLMSFYLNLLSCIHIYA